MFSMLIAAIALQAAPVVPPATVVSPPAPPPPASPSPAPHYTQDAAWLCRPDRADACAANQDVTVIQANGKRKIEKFKIAPLRQFDCFYVYPTVSQDPTPNSDMNAGIEEQTVAAFQAARFTQTCRVFAPIYRQVTLTALRALMTGAPLNADFPMALADVTAAWNDYLARDNGGRGVVLIGHSQGALLLTSLIKQSIESQPIRRNIVSAMLLGTNVAVPQGQAIGGDFK
ncbi:hypothetical protein BH09PSE4_BH09PSE4_08050 [soil metagenome]